MSGSERYADWKSQIRSELEAMEGEGPPSTDDLWGLAGYEAHGAGAWIDDMPVTEDSIKTAKGDILKSLTALEMAEELLGSTDER